MKSLILAVALLLTSGFAIAQPTEPKETKKDPFVSAGVGYTPAGDLSYSGEVGCWGNTSVTSFSITYDATRTTLTSAGGFGHWLGIKGYWTVGSTDELQFMVYAAEKINTRNAALVTDFGFNPNYVLSKNLLLGVSVGNQITSTSQWNLYSSIGFVYLFK